MPLGGLLGVFDPALPSLLSSLLTSFKKIDSLGPDQIISTRQIPRP
jgi:hypothetical protein